MEGRKEGRISRGGAGRKEEKKEGRRKEEGRKARNVNEGSNEGRKEATKEGWTGKKKRR